MLTTTPSPTSRATSPLHQSRYLSPPRHRCRRRLRCCRRRPSVHHLAIYIREKMDGSWPNHTSLQVSRVVYLKIIFQERYYELHVAGFQFQPLKESVELDQVKVYQDVVKAASHSLVYASLHELEVFLFDGVYLNG
ncbi:hypothetical protein Tco_0592404 [Tanacetum coccineum]